LGGLGKAMGGGENRVLAALNREIDRDIQLQKESLDRKESMYKTFLDEGKSEIEAWKLTRGVELDVAAARLAAQSAKFGSPQARLAADATVLALQDQAAKNRADADASFYTRQFAQWKGIEDVKLERKKVGVQIEKNRIDAFDARTRRTAVEQAGRGDGTGKTLEVEIMPGQWIRAADPTARAKIAEARGGHEGFINALDKMEEMRRVHGKAWLPAWLAWTGASEAEQKAVGESMVNAVRLAWLKGEGAGAYDKGSGELATKTLPNPVAPSVSDGELKGVIKMMRDQANAQYMAKVRGNMAPGQAPELFGSAPMQARVVGRVQ